VLARNFAGGIFQKSLDVFADEALIISGAKPVRDAVGRLEAYGWIVIEKPRDANRRGRGLRYQPAMPAVSAPSSHA
jgi:hypothetical protein